MYFSPIIILTKVPKGRLCVSTYITTSPMIASSKYLLHLSFSILLQDQTDKKDKIEHLTLFDPYPSPTGGSSTSESSLPSPPAPSSSPSPSSSLGSAYFSHKSHNVYLMIGKPSNFFKSSSLFDTYIINHQSADACFVIPVVCSCQLWWPLPQVDFQ